MLAGMIPLVIKQPRVDDRSLKGHVVILLQP